ncbi:hypothetical protein [Spirillospora sp. NPDC048819]|uniref:hypothetical protein n=1 Tax=Spirillospora sp. NPDC048819 TaxID=3155268 RepID=UPI0033C8167F
MVPDDGIAGERRCPGELPAFEVAQQMQVRVACSRAADADDDLPGPGFGFGDID